MNTLIDILNCINLIDRNAQENVLCYKLTQLKRVKQKNLYLFPFQNPFICLNYIFIKVIKK